MTKIGFVGLGIMGRPMARNLIKAGHELVVADINPDAVDELVAEGAASASSPAEVASQVEVLITMLPNSPHVEQVVLGPTGVLEGAKNGLIYVDMSSIAPGTAQKVAKACAEKGIKVLDAPVSGGEPKAIDGSLAIMVGGPEDVFKQVEPLLFSMGATVVLVGDVGTGNITKLANQIIVGVNIAAMSEALTLAAKAGADPAKVVDAIAGGLAGSTVLNMKAPMVLEGNYNAGFRIELHIKDLHNALQTGKEVKCPVPMSSRVLDMMKSLAADGHQTDDHGGLIQYYEKEAGVKVRG